MTVIYRYIGKGKTDANGVAHITEDAEGNDISSNPGYTGVGAGKIDFVASLDDLSDVTIDVNPSTINDTTAGVSHSISATVMDDGSAVQNKSVVFELYKVSDGSLVETLTGVTNSSGVVTVSYLGKYAGHLYIKSYCGNAVSQPTSVIDGTFFGNELSKWVYNSSTISASKSGDEISISTTDTTDRYFYANVGDTSSYDDFVPPYALEFEVVSFDGYIAIMNWASNNNGNRSFSQLGVTANSKVKFLVKSDKIEYYVDGTKSSYELAITGTPTFRVGFVVNNSSVTFKNFVIYPI